MALEMVTGTGRIEWRIDRIPVDYQAAVDAMEARVAAIRAGSAPELVWLLEHPALYTAGTSAREEDLLDPRLLPVHRSGRGGRSLIMGPGSASPMSCSISTAAIVTCVAMCTGSKSG